MKNKKKKLIIGIAIVFAVIIGSIVGFALYINDNGEQVEYEDGHNITNKDTVTENTPTVYMTTDISSESLMKIYESLNFQPTGNVAVKISTGEPPASNYLKPELIKDLVQSVDGTIVECNTAYGGSRSKTEMHKQVAKDHGFTDIANVDPNLPKWLYIGCRCKP